MPTTGCDGLVPSDARPAGGLNSVVAAWRWPNRGGRSGRLVNGTPRLVVEWWCALEQSRNGADTVAKGRCIEMVRVGG